MDSFNFNCIAGPKDFAGQLAIDRHPLITDEILRGQHPQRSWEYSLALYALEYWAAVRYDGRSYFNEANPLFADIGGAGSNFWRTFSHYTKKPATAIDPNHAWDSDSDAALYFRDPLRVFKREHPDQQFDVVFCLSVIEHVPSTELQQFEQDLCSLVKPRGLLALTCDAGESHPDVYHFNWMRERIYTPAGLDALQVVFQQQYGLKPLTPPDYQWTGPTVYDFSIASLVFTKGA